MSTIAVAALAFSILAFSADPLSGGPAQVRLLKKIAQVNGAERIAFDRPVVNDSDSVVVKIGFNVQQIIQLDAKEQYLESLIWIEQYWQDDYATWNPAEYDGIAKIRLPPHMLWRPDILMYNSADEKFDGTWPVNLVVEHTGSVSYIPPAMLKSNRSTVKSPEYLS